MLIETKHSQNRKETETKHSQQGKKKKIEHSQQFDFT